MRMIIALDLDRLIGRSDGSLPWHLPGDLARFKRLTMGQSIIVGRRTAETLPKLPGRTVLVATGGNLADLCAAYPDAWIAGGGQIYKAALASRVVTEVYATRVMRSEDIPEDELGPPFAKFAPYWEFDRDFALRSVELGGDVNTVYERWTR